MVECSVNLDNVAVGRNIRTFDVVELWIFQEVRVLRILEGGLGVEMTGQVFQNHVVIFMGRHKTSEDVEEIDNVLELCVVTANIVVLVDVSQNHSQNSRQSGNELADWSDEFFHFFVLDKLDLCVSEVLDCDSVGSQFGLDVSQRGLQVHVTGVRFQKRGDFLRLANVSESTLKKSVEFGMQVARRKEAEVVDLSVNVFQEGEDRFSVGLEIANQVFLKLVQEDMGVFFVVHEGFDENQAIEMQHVFLLANRVVGET